MLVRSSSQCAGSHNRFLAHLSRDDAALLDGQLERVTLLRGAMLVTCGASFDFIYFPETIIVSIGSHPTPGRRVEAAVIGFEGIVGWPAFFGSFASHHDATVQMGSGTAWRIARQDLVRACSVSVTLPAAAMRFADCVSAQMTQAILSVACDTVERRLCRWLLMRHDRVLTDQLIICHDEISGSLGTRRASVTDSLHVLEGERLVRCHRGRIVIRDRAGLERAAAGSYGVTEAYYRAQIAPFGRTLTQPA